MNLATFGRFMLRSFVIQTILMLFAVTSVMGQGTATVSGFLQDEFGGPLIGATIILVETGKGTSSNRDGHYQITIPAGRPVTLKYSFIGLETKLLEFDAADGDYLTESFQMKQSIQSIGQGVEITATRRTTTMTPLKPELATYIPLPSDDITQLLAVAGANIRNELSSSYSVRGGSFDENLIYVNDIEIYRPFLVRAGQQEGLSFPNSDMVESILFSAGGFEARYGDKLSSVLDIQYKRPKEFAGSARGSLLGGAIHIEGASKKGRLRHIHGLRYKTNQYILNSLETQGEYRPNFMDFQTFLTYNLTDQWEMVFLGHYARNRYNFNPQTRQTEFGTVNQALQLTVFFEGQEVDAFETYTGALGLNHRSTDDRTLLKFTGSIFRTFETETFDILGQYWLDELERDLGSESFGEVAFNRGVGSFLNHARNTLDATVANFQHKGFHSWGPGESRYLQWGAKIQHEVVNDQLSEWNYVDSAGFSLPIAPSNQIVLQDVVKAKINLRTNRYTAYVQNSWSWKLRSMSDEEDTARIELTAGVRAHLWDFNNQFVWSPRANLAYTPLWKVTKTDEKKDSTYTFRRDIVFRFSTGYYHQPPFYRELRDFQGILNPEIRAQRSAHFVLGADYIFPMWNRPFKLVAELYYKHLWDLIPYEVDNVRIRYFATNNSGGYATGLDVKLNGEFVKGIQSWVSMGILKTEEDLLDDFYYDYKNSDGETILFGFTDNDSIVDSTLVTPGNIPRPQDQRFSFSMFFQDEMPRWPTYKVHLNFIFSTGLPFGPPTQERYKDVLRTPSYRRVDIGFSKELIGPNVKRKKPGGGERKIESMWLSFEIFNLLGVNNTINYLWIKDVTNRQYAIPNFLTNRRVNLKVAMRF